MLENFSEIEVISPVDKIIEQIRSLISTGQLKPGDKLPPERKLAEKFKVGRTTVRDAIKKLEFYGIVKTIPQSGTIVSGLGIVTLESLITDILSIEGVDFTSLVETRILLEINAARKAAERRTTEDLIALKKAMLAFEEKALAGKPAVEEDLLFHIKIAEASRNNVLKSLMLIITPDVIKSFNELNVCENDRALRTINEHRIIMEHIENKNELEAEMAMKDHLKELSQFSQNYKI